MADRIADIAVLAATDTKGAETEYLLDALGRHRLTATVVDIRLESGGRVLTGDEKVAEMRRVAERARGTLERLRIGGVTGAVGLGGGVGTWIGMEALRGLPFGWPKLMVSTLPFDPRPCVAESDIVLMPSVIDILGLNPTLRRVLDNAAAAMAGLVAPRQGTQPPRRPVVGLTALGVTTFGAMDLCRRLEARGYEVTTFHANGLGGQAFERWVRDGAFTAVVDFTTHELNGLLFGGPAPHGADRMTAAGATGIPQVVVPGGLDIIGRGPFETLSEDERTRQLCRHSTAFTHLRSLPAEMDQAAEMMAQRLNRSQGPVRIVVPLGGFSVENRSGGALWLPDSLETFAQTLRRHLLPSIPIDTVPAHINSPAFVDAVMSAFDAVVGARTGAATGPAPLGVSS